MNLALCECIYVSCSSNCYTNCVDCSDNLIIFASNNSIAIYDLDVRRVVSVLYDHSDLVNSVRWIDNNQNYFISSSVDRTNIIWQKIDDNKFTIKYIHNGHRERVMISDSILLETSSTNQPEFFSISSSTDKCLCFWENDKLVLSESSNHFTFDIKIYQNLLIPGIIVLTVGSDCLIHINQFDIENKKFFNLIELKGHKDWIKSIDLVCINEKLMLASASQDFQIRINEIKCLPQQTDETNDEINYNSNNVFVVGKDKQYLVTLESILSGHNGWVTNVKWINQMDPNRLYLLSSSMDKTIILWEQKQPEMGDDDVGYWNEKIRFGEIGENYYGFLSCSFISSRNLIIGQSFNGAIHIWKKQDDNQWSPYIPITGHSKEVTDIAWEPEGEYYLTCSSDQTTRLHSEWKPDKGSPSSWHEMARPQIHGYDLKSVSWFGRLKFVSGADEKVIRIFKATKNFIGSIQNLSRVYYLPHNFDKEDQNDFAEFAITPTLGLSNSAVYDTNTIDSEHLKPRIMDSPPSEEILMQNTLWSEIQKLYGHGFEIFTVAVNHDFTILASACKATNVDSATILIWDLKTFKKIYELQAHNLTVTQLRFSPNDHFLLSVSRDRSWTIFDMIDPLQGCAYVDTEIHSRIIWDCAWTPDSKYFITASRDKTICTVSFNHDEAQIIIQEILTFEHSVNSIDILQKYLNNSFYLMCLALENGEMFLYMSAIQLSKIRWVEVYNFKDFRHMSPINRIRFSPRIIHNRGGERRIVFYLATASQDKSSKLFKIKF